jgi:osmotically-inducible protein OsmY
MADLDARSIWVTANDSTVHLHGRVHSVAASRTAERAAEASPDVSRVVNDLVVVP